jgi:hypothetical protein
MNNIYKQLETIIEHGIRNNPLPFKKGNSIRVGKIVVRQNSNNYVVFDIENNKSIGTALTLRGALALAKSCKKYNELSMIKTLDRKYFKNYNDCIFYKSTLVNTKDSFKKSVVKDRLEIAQDEMLAMAKSLEDIIFDNKR